MQDRFLWLIFAGEKVQAYVDEKFMEGGEKGRECAGGREHREFMREMKCRLRNLFNTIIYILLKFSF